MEINVNVETRQFIYTSCRSQFIYKLNATRCPNIGEHFELVTRDATFYGLISKVETYYNVDSKEERIYVTLIDDTEPIED